MNELVTMNVLIEALQIFLKYKNKKYPTHCEHDVLMVGGYTQEEISEQDTERLNELGFSWSDEHDCFVSYRFGRALFGILIIGE